MNWLVMTTAGTRIGGKKFKPAAKGKPNESRFRRLAAKLIAQLPENMARRLLRDFDL